MGGESSGKSFWFGEFAVCYHDTLVFNKIGFQLSVALIFTVSKLLQSWFRFVFGELFFVGFGIYFGLESTLNATAGSNGMPQA